MNKALCPVTEKCGGCQLLHLPYRKQLEQKQRLVDRLLKPYCPVKPILGAENPLHYRNKVHAAFGTDWQGHIICGTYQAGTHRIVPVQQCCIEDPLASRIIHAVRKLMIAFRIAPYNEDTGRGVIRHVLVRIGRRTGQALVTLVIGRPDFPARKAFVDALVQNCPGITSVVVNLNSTKTSMILGQSSRVAYGRGWIEDELCGLTFGISPSSFYQVNAEQAQRLYETAIGYAGLTGRESLLDAYCGIGTIGLAAAGRAARVTGVELNPDAVQDAIRNARRNGIANARFFEGDAGEFLRAGKAGPLDVVMMDPPRAGSDRRFLQSLCQSGAGRIVYVSCNPETLARDLDYLIAHGYRALEATPVDMFPQTEHVETVVFVSRVTKNELK